MKTKRMLLLITITFIASSLLWVNGARALSMQDLIQPGAFLIIDDKKFYDFGYESVVVLPENIQVEPLTTLFNPGLRFTGGLFAPQAGNSRVEVSILYKVAVLPGGLPIKDVSLLTEDYVLIGQGDASVGESVFLDNTLIASLQNSFGQQFDSAVFNPTNGPISVIKDILLVTVTPDDFATLSIEQRYSEGYSEVPEPSTMLLLGSGLLGLWGARKKFKK